MKRIHYKIFMVNEDSSIDTDTVLTAGTINVSKAIKNHSLAWVEKEEKGMREFFYHGNVNNMYFDFSFEAIVAEGQEAGYINSAGGDYFEEDAFVEEHNPDSYCVKETYDAWVEITIE